MDNSVLKYPIQYETLKTVLRVGLETKEEREHWWPVLTNVFTKDSINEYPDIVPTAERCCKLLNEPLLDVKNQAPFEVEKCTEFVTLNAKMLFYVLRQNKKIDTNDMAYFDTMLRIVVYAVKRIDVCYVMATELLNRRDKYFIPGHAGHHCMLYTYKELLNKHAPKTFTVLNTMGALDGRYLNLMFVDMFAEILPEYILLRMLDAYLLEGTKVLYRFGLALVLGYKAQLKSGKYQSGSAFWNCVKADAVAAANDQESLMLCKFLGIEETLPVVDPFLLFENAKNKAHLQSEAIFDAAYDTQRSLVQKASKPLNISRATLKALADAAEKCLPPPAELPSSPLQRKSSVSLGARKNSVTETLGNTTNSSDVKRDTMSRKNSRASLSPMTRLSVTDGGGTPKSELPTGKMSPEREQPVDVNVVASEMHNQSSILSLQQTTYLLSACVPQLVSGFTLRFSTKHHGWNLSSLYALTAELTPCLLLVNLLPPYENAVLGVFINTPLSPPSLSMRGDNYSSVFNLDVNDSKVFQWVGDSGARLGRRVADDIANEGGEETGDGVESTTLRQYAVCTNHYMAFGGSREHGTNALRLDEDMRHVHTGPSDTFGNPALLVPEGVEPSPSGAYQFEVENVELWCGTHSLNHAKRMGKFPNESSSA